MRRTGLTLLEMAVCLASSTMLVAGLASSIYLSTQTLPGNENASRKAAQASGIVRDVISDVSMALSFTERTARAMTFTVPDRNGDDMPETIRYAWSGTVGDPLTYQYNSGTVISVATGVQAFNLEGLTRTMLAEAMSAPVAGNVVFEQFTENKALPAVNIQVAKPSGTVEGSLLVAAVSVDGDVRTTMPTPSGWTLVSLGPTGVSAGMAQQTFAVYWKLATASEPTTYPFTWTASKHAYAWIMRISGHNATSPIHTSNMLSGVSLLPTITSPEVITTVENAMILRLGGFDGRAIVVDVPGLLLHTPITMDSSRNIGTMSCSGGAGYMTLANPGNSGTSAFVLVGALGEDFTTVTIAIAPAMDE
jgi:hypothetical protein